MPLRSIAIVYRKELTEALRDRRTLVSSLLLPLVLFPVLTAGFGAVAGYMIGRAQRQTVKVMIVGGEDSPEVVDHIKKIEKVSVVPATPDWKEHIANKEISAAVEIPMAFEANIASNKSDLIKIYIYKNQMKSEVATGRLERGLQRYKESIVTERLAAHGLAPSLSKPFELKQENVVSEEKSWAEILGGMIGYMVILLCLTGGMYPAMDLTAGEKERGTMETILSSPVSRGDLVFGKFLLVLTASLVTAILSVCSMGLSFSGLRHLSLSAAPDPGEAARLNLNLSITAIFSIFVMAVPLAVLFSSCLMAISVFAKSYKEAQTYTSPLMMLVIVPSVAAMLPGADLNAKLALVPILNASLLCKELVIGTYHWNFIAIIFFSTCVYAAFALFLAVKMFQRETVLFRA